KVNFWNSLGTEFDGISSGKIYIKTDNGSKLNYDYFLGGAFIYVIVLFIILFIIARFVAQWPSRSRIFAPFFLAAIILLWVSTIVKQRRFFKQIIKQIEEKWGRVSIFSDQPTLAAIVLKKSSSSPLLPTPIQQLIAHAWRLFGSYQLPSSDMNQQTSNIAE